MTLAPMPGLRAVHRLEAPDRRADGRRRVVLVDRDSVAIARSIAGVFMHIALSPSAYLGILLRLANLDEVGFRYEIHLAHQDPDFGILLAQSDDEAEVQGAWRRWSRFFRLPLLVERLEGTWEPARPIFGSSVANGPEGGRRRRGPHSGRPRFFTRRKVGRPELCVPVATERELFAGLRPE
jgi:hypothetical protein